MTPDEFADRIALPLPQLYRLSTRVERCYQTFYRRKSSGKRRRIDAPNRELKGIQLWILRNLLDSSRFPSYINGFVEGRNIKTNALSHVKKSVVACIDIRDFYPSIHEDKVFEIFKSRTADVNTAELLTRICTLNGRLPQGGVTSPMLSNLCFLPVDEEIIKICDSQWVNYTRYADDLTFSSDNHDRVITILRQVADILNKFGFTINKSKSRIMTGNKAIIVTGLRINSGKPSIGRNTKRILRAQLHHYILNQQQDSERRILGMMAFLRSIEPGKYKTLVQYTRRLSEKYSSS